MWEASCREVGPCGRRYRLTRKGRALRFQEVIEGWSTDPAFRSWYVALLAGTPFPAYFWETPPVTTASRERSFEFVLIDCPQLAATTPDPSPFAAHFSAAGPDESVASFANLGGDAYLIAPCPRVADHAYLHLGAFTRNAPDEQQHELWRVVGSAVTARLSTRPLWVSTAGLGVFWLHVRLDTRPKYYRHRPYRQADIDRSWDAE